MSLRAVLPCAEHGTVWQSNPLDFCREAASFLAATFSYRVLLIIKETCQEILKKTCAFSVEIFK